MVGCITESDEALTWYCVTRLTDAISSVSPTSPVDEGPQQQKEEITLAGISEARKERGRVDPEEHARERPGEDVDRLVEKPTTRLDEAEALDPLTKAGLKSRRGYLLITLIDLTTVVGAGLLVPLLDRITWFFAEEAEAGSLEESRKALVKLLYRSLASGMDMTKRELGAKWWLERRGDLEWAENAGLTAARL